MISCSLTLVALFLTSLGLGDSPLVILSLCSLVLFFVISLCWFSCVLVFVLFFSFLFSFCSPLCILCVVFVLLCFFNIIFLLIKKKKFHLHHFFIMSCALLQLGMFLRFGSKRPMVLICTCHFYQVEVKKKWMELGG